MRLYDYPVEIDGCIDYETGEVDSERLAELAAGEENKLEGIGKAIKCLKVELEALKQEKKNIDARTKSTEKALESMSRFVGQYLGGEKRTVGSVKFMFLGKQEGKINLLVPAKELPEEYRTASTSWRENGTAIREALDNGVDLSKYLVLDIRPKASVK